MKLGYNTNGLAHHEPLQAIDLLAQTGYECVGITIDHFLLAPDNPNTAVQLEQIAAKLAKNNLGSVIESGARFLLDPSRKHWPTLLENNQDLGWDEATIPLEALPTSRPSNPALQEAGSRSSNNGNQ